MFEKRSRETTILVYKKYSMKDIILKSFPGRNVDTNTTFLIPIPNNLKPVRKDKYADIKDRLLNTPGPIGDALRNKKYDYLRSAIRELKRTSSDDFK